jgi:MFS family permease
LRDDGIRVLTSSTPVRVQPDDGARLRLMVTLPRTHTPPWAVLAVLCLAVFLINVSTLIVNIALPQISSQLGASSADLSWIVDGFNLSFSALVLAGGSLSDRYGRRRALIAGLALFAAALRVPAAARLRRHDVSGCCAWDSASAIVASASCPRTPGWLPPFFRRGTRKGLSADLVGYPEHRRSTTDS